MDTFYRTLLMIISIDLRSIKVIHWVILILGLILLFVVLRKLVDFFVDSTRRVFRKKIKPRKLACPPPYFWRK